MSRGTSRRTFVKTTAALGVGYWVAGGIEPRRSLSANEVINFASIGIDGKGASDSADAARSGNLVAICDIDDNRLGKAGERKNFEKAKKYTDFRKMLEENEKEIDAVTVSTPDHTHAVAAAMAMRMKKHAFVQKPMCKTIEESRVLGGLAREHKLATQMGNQGTATSSLREAAAVVKSGAMGKIKEVHVWTNRPVWPQGKGLVVKTEPAPAHVHWPEFIGPAKMREYSSEIHPFKWRGFWAFGTGALGDMACHTLNMPYMALGLRDPVALQAVTDGHDEITFPKWSMITYEFPEREGRAALTFKWYDGGKMPENDMFKGVEAEKIKKSGCLVVGEKGTLYAPGDYAEQGLHCLGFDKPDVEIVKSPGHFEEWVRAIKGGEPAMSNFSGYADGLTETVLLGNLAVWTAKNSGEPGPRVEWDAKTMVAKNAETAGHLIKANYENGYKL